MSMTERYGRRIFLVDEFSEVVICAPALVSAANSFFMRINVIDEINCREKYKGIVVARNAR